MSDREQLDLFAAAATPVTPGWAGAVEGMTRAIEHAENDEPGWGSRATEKLLEFMREHPGMPFIAPNVRYWAERRGLARPDNDRAWGAVFLAARRRGLIRHAGYMDYGDDRMNTQAVKVWMPGDGANGQH